MNSALPYSEGISNISLSVIVNSVEFCFRLSGQHDFYILETPVTQQQWQAIMGTNPSLNPGPTNPVECVSYYDCLSFCEQFRTLTGLKCRLPSSTEWQRAANGRVGSIQTRYSGSDNIEEVAWYRINSDGHSHPVKQKAPNTLGLYDMTGNVLEWCINHGIEPDKRIVAGGCFDSRDRDCEIFISSSYKSYCPNVQKSNTGFRVLLELA